MPDTMLEKRIAALEKKVAELTERVLSPPVQEDWRSTVGMFAGSALMKEIDEEGAGSAKPIGSEPGVIVLDTDHMVVLKYAEGAEYTALSARMAASPDQQFATTCINFFGRAASGVVRWWSQRLSRSFALPIDRLRDSPETD